MKLVARFFLFALVLGVGTSSCRDKEFLSVEEFQEWIASNDKSKEVSNVEIRSRYVPAQYLAYKDFMSSPQAGSYDSILKLYQCGITFQVTLSADKADKAHGNLKYYNVTSPEDLSARIQNLSFHSGEFISLEYNNVTYSPVLNNFEGFDELGNRVSFTVVFQLDDFKCGSPAENFSDIKLIFDDPYWDLGTNNFIFENKIFTSIPKLKM